MGNIDVEKELEKIAEETYNFKQEREKELVDRLKSEKKKELIDMLNSELNTLEIETEYYKEILELHGERVWLEACIKYNNSKIKELREAIEVIEV